AHVWVFARQLESAFINHLERLLAPGGIVYLSDTVHVCWLSQYGAQGFTTEGCWTATRTSRLVDYLRPASEVLTERSWSWVRSQGGGAYWGRLYGVQAIIYRVP